MSCCLVVRMLDLLASVLEKLFGIQSLFAGLRLRVGESVSALANRSCFLDEGPV